MAITFPTRPALERGILGTPERAHPCRCGDRALAHSDQHHLVTCIWCGHLDRDAIDNTWRHRAHQLETAQAA